MIKISVNEKIILVEDFTTVYDIKMKYNSCADLVIHNGYIADDSSRVQSSDNLVLIERGKIPTYNELEYMMVARHTPTVYNRLKAASVAIVGVGGLGSNAAISLTRMGFGTIKIIDYDIVEPSNLNRQFYFINQIGMKKVDALYETLKNINPYINIIKSDILIDEKNFKSQLEGFDILIEAVDKADVKSFIFRYGLKTLSNTFIIGASGVAGYYDTSILEIKQLNNRAVIVGDFVNEAKKGEGLMATRVAVAANIQANLAVRFIMGDWKYDKDNS